MLRTHKNNALNKSNLGQEVRLVGWVAVMRDHGGLNFVDLRDRWGVTQLVFNPNTNSAVHQKSQSLRSEFCIGVKGIVRERPQGTVNSKLSTGEIEVEVTELTIFSASQTPPFEITSDQNFSEELRLKYRYLDLRRAPMRDAMLFRNAFIHHTRNYFHDREFVEVETPILTKSTPEGARDYLVPSRVHHEHFFALPQSPQIFKQILMVSGMDRYYQIAKCFRDEDLRADRQPEFTQLDLEMSFASPEDIFELLEGWVRYVNEKFLKLEMTIPFPRYTYADVMSRFGSDKPDLRFGLEMRDVSSSFATTELKIFRQTVDNGGVILALQVPNSVDKFSRKDLDDLVQFAKDQGAGGLAYLKVTDKGLESPIAKFFTEKETEALSKALPEKLKVGDVVFFAADKKKLAQSVLGAVRLRLGKSLGLIQPGVWKWAWVHEFPLFQWNEEDKRWDSEHHPFTSAHPEDAGKLGNDNGNIRSLSYDLVLNGNEIASGSVRIHDSAMQSKVFDTIGIDKEEQQKRFGFMLNAFSYGPPPHAGIAAGIDRLAAIFLGRDSIRDVIAFPKTQKAICLMTDAPSEVSTRQMKELGIRPL